uniref:Uncharacterized protein n=1 Tax=Sphaeramia orbicularis TaxID=375764 RepID=A0A673AQ17_9TELE
PPPHLLLFLFVWSLIADQINLGSNLSVVQSNPDQLLHSPLAWGGGWHGLSGAKAPTQLLLIQQPAIPAPSSSTLTPSSSVAPPQNHVRKGSGHGSKNSYLPILNSYPRIAPHPRKEGHGSKSASWVQGVKESGSEGHSQSKRVCTEEEKREAVSTTTHLLKPQQKDPRVHSYSQYKGRSSSFPTSSHRPLPGQASSTTKPHHCQQSSSSDSVSSPSVSSSQTPSPPCSSDSPSSSSPPSSSPPSSAAHSPYRLAPDSTSTRQRRFLNTAEILNQSGLLAITLRTKELLKQNAATEREIAQLRQHTNLLCQAAQARHSEGSDSFDKLVHIMTESGSYPDLHIDQVQTLSSSSNNQQSKNQNQEKKEKDVRTTTINPTPTLVSFKKNIDDGTSPPSPLFAPSPETEEREHTPLDLLSSSLSLSFSTSDSKLGQRQAVTDKDLSELSILPESSTHNNYLL